jgi:hypothetical protein
MRALKLLTLSLIGFCISAELSAQSIGNSILPNSSTYPTRSFKSNLLLQRNFLENVNKGQIIFKSIDTTSTFLSDTVAILITPGNCKSNRIEYIVIGRPLISAEPARDISISEPAKVTLFTIKGFVSYEYYFNQRIDTPYSSSSYQQHAERIQLQINFKDKYPLFVNFDSRQSNNIYFKDIFDFGVRFDKNEYLNSQRKRYIDRLSKFSPNQKALLVTSEELEKLVQKVERMSFDLNAPSLSQKVIHEREVILKKYSDPSAKIDLSYDSSLFIERLSLNTYKFKKTENLLTINENINVDSTLITPTEKWYAEQMKKFEALKVSRLKMSLYCDSLKKIVSNEESCLKNSFGSSSKWKRYLKKFGGEDFNENKFDKLLLNLKNFGFGRNSVDFSDLTIRNMTLTGLQIEYEPGLYYALAGGKIDYRFRDFLLNSHAVKSPEFYIARIGSGFDKPQGITLSVFEGIKYQMVNNSLRRAPFTGYSIEVFQKFAAENSIQFEFAKTQVSNSSTLTGVKPTSLFDFKTEDNLAIAGKFKYKIIETNTYLSGSYSKMGYSFQSLNILNNNTNRKAWFIKGEQDFFHRTLRATVMVRQNDFSSPDIIHNYNVNAIFKTFILSYRRRGLPFLSIGYFPGVQLLRTDSAKFIENVYYMINATAGYSKSFNSLSSNTIINYNMFINQSTDSGFVYYKGKTFQINQLMSVGKFNLQCGYSYTKQPKINFYTVEAGFDITINKNVTMGCGVKYNKVLSGYSYWGGQSNATIHLGKIGVLQVNYDKLFIPNYSNQLISADMGRIHWIKYF